MKKILVLTVALVALAGSVNAECGVMTCSGGGKHGVCVLSYSEDFGGSLADMMDVVCGDDDDNIDFDVMW